MREKRKKLNVGIVGATGAVGEEMRLVLEKRNFPVGELRLFASARSAGKKLNFRGREIKVEELSPASPGGLDVVLFSAGAGVSREYARRFTDKGSFVIDNSSAWRMEPDIPLVVPEVNPGTVSSKTRLIANPNCSTIQMVVALKPLYDFSPIKRIVVSTYQAVSGAGGRAMQELKEQVSAEVKGDSLPLPQKFPHPIAFNCLPHIDIFENNLYTREEMKMVRETRKILGDQTIAISATTVRVPVWRGHSEAVWIETKEKITPEKARELLKNAPGVVLMDEPSKNIYPQPRLAGNTDPVYVGRIRQDLSNEKGLVLWVVADNLLKGAALNAVQIAELLIAKNIL